MIESGVGADLPIASTEPLFIKKEFSMPLVRTFHAGLAVLAGSLIAGSAFGHKPGAPSAPPSVNVRPAVPDVSGQVRGAITNARDRAGSGQTGGGAASNDPQGRIAALDAQIAASNQKIAQMGIDYANKIGKQGNAQTQELNAGREVNRIKSRIAELKRLKDKEGLPYDDWARYDAELNTITPELFKKEDEQAAAKQLIAEAIAEAKKIQSDIAFEMAARELLKSQRGELPAGASAGLINQIQGGLIDAGVNFFKK